MHTHLLETPLAFFSLFVETSIYGFIYIHTHTHVRTHLLETPLAFLSLFVETCIYEFTYIHTYIHTYACTPA
jgi:hypothetical protein